MLKRYLVLMLLILVELRSGYFKLKKSKSRLCFFVETFGGLNIALHAQSRYQDHGWVAGSEITTSGLLAALRRSTLVSRAEVFAPFAYKGYRDVAWDYLIIEGWTGPLPRFIHKMRTHHPSIKVVHWCLDTYPDMETIAGLDVDGFLTNSRTLVRTLGKVAPTFYVPLAADSNVMAPVSTREEYAHPVVYLGQVRGLSEESLYLVALPPLLFPH
jgi:hypothetical protein